MDEYNFRNIEAKWQKHWEDTNYATAEDFSDKPKHYNLVEFPYPSGAGLHIGHCMGYGASDAFCRMKRMQGYNVMYPMGWDAFGLPTENYAIKNKVKPQEITAQAVATFKKQMNSLGYSFDWSREVNTADPAYYKWTQWIFLQFYKHAVVNEKLISVGDNDTTTPRLAYQAKIPVNWCPSCKIVLANEEVINSTCERCGTTTEKRNQKQWMLRITSYADRLINDLETVDYLDKIKTQQINWIGKSIGSNIKFKIKNSDEIIEVFTTRVDTLFGCTYVVLAPESDLISRLKSQVSNLKEAEEYIKKTKSKSDLERTELEKDKTGIKLDGIKAINPINNEEVDVYTADYVLASYGTGAVMAVPAHDNRDFEFAKKYNIKIKQVIAPDVTYFKTLPKEGVPYVERIVTESIIYDPKQDKYLILKWRKQPWETFITGGVNNNEDIIEAAKREITEETGLINVKFVRNLGVTRPRFYAAHKNENRKAIFTGLLFELVDDQKIDTKWEDHEDFEIIWKSLDELNINDIVCASFDYWIKALKNQEEAFTNYGVLINSGDFNGLETSEAKTKIT